jgi:hypothetical protein
LMFHFVYHFKLLSHLLQAKWVKTHWILFVIGKGDGLKSRNKMVYTPY